MKLFLNRSFDTDYHICKYLSYLDLLLLPTINSYFRSLSKRDDFRELMKVKYYQIKSKVVKVLTSEFEKIIMMNSPDVYYTISITDRNDDKYYLIINSAEYIENLQDVNMDRFKFKSDNTYIDDISLSDAIYQKYKFEVSFYRKLFYKRAHVNNFKEFSTYFRNLGSTIIESSDEVAATEIIIPFDRIDPTIT